MRPSRSYVEGGRNGENGKRPDSYEDLGLTVRCISFGAPRIGGGYNSYMQIVQSPKTVAIVQETIHDARIIPVDGSPHPPANVKLLHGDSRGHWEGDTLVVDTTNYSPESLMTISEKLHVIERFPRTAAEYITWTVTFDDPETWTKPWTVEIPLRHTTTRSTSMPATRATTDSGNSGGRPRRGCPRGCQNQNRAQVVFADSENKNRRRHRGVAPFCLFGPQTKAGTPERIRTSDLLLRRQTLYPD